MVFPSVFFNGFLVSISSFLLTFFVLFSFFNQRTICYRRWVEADVARGRIEWGNWGGGTGNAVANCGFISMGDLRERLLFCYDGDVH